MVRHFCDSGVRQFVHVVCQFLDYGVGHVQCYVRHKSDRGVRHAPRFAGVKSDNDAPCPGVEGWDIQLTSASHKCDPGVGHFYIDVSRVNDSGVSHSW